MYLLTLVVNFIVAFYTIFVRYIHLFMTFSKLLFITLFSTKRKEVNDVTLRRRS